MKKWWKKWGSVLAIFAVLVGLFLFSFFFGHLMNDEDWRYEREKQALEDYYNDPQTKQDRERELAGAE